MTTTTTTPRADGTATDLAATAKDIASDVADEPSRARPPARRGQRDGRPARSAPTR